MHSFSMRPAKYFYEKQLPKYLDPKTVLFYHPHPVYLLEFVHGWWAIVFFAQAVVYSQGGQTGH